MLERLLAVKPGLDKLVADPAWKRWSKRSKFRSRAASAEKLIHSKSTWKKIDNLIKLLE